MDLTPQPKTPAAIVDASLIIGFCTKEPNKYGIAKATLDEYDNDGRQLFAPSVLIGEVLHVLCRKLKDNSLDAAGHASALSSFIAIMSGISPPPTGDASLIPLAEQFRGALTCQRSNDAFYLALAEQLNADRKTELATFDAGMKSQANAYASTVDVKVLPVLRS